MRHKIMTPVAGFTGKVAGVAFADGTAVVDDDNEAHRRALAYFQRRRYRVEPVAAEQPDPEPDPVVDEQPPPPPAPPARGDTKANWVAYAAEHGGMSADDAEKQTRDQLAEKYLGPKEA